MARASRHHLHLERLSDGFRILSKFYPTDSEVAAANDLIILLFEDKKMRDCKN